MKISVVIPTYNEAEVIRQTLSAVRERAEEPVHEVIVADGGSADNTAGEAVGAGAELVRSPKGRAVQMNHGAKQASGDVLYFLHADTIPPHNYDRSIRQALAGGAAAGCFQLSFDSDNLFLKVYAWFTRFNIDAFRFGDQSLFIRKGLFETIRGFREDHIVMEDHEIIKRIKKTALFCIRPESVETSSRKYKKVGVVKLQLLFSIIFLGYYLGMSQQALVSLYKNQIGK